MTGSPHRWTLITASGARDITSDVVQSRIEWGARWLPRASQWVLHPARGHLNIDANSKWEAGGPLISNADVSGPISAAFSADGSTTTWAGLVHITPSPVLGADATMQWPLTSRWASALATPIVVRPAASHTVAGYGSPLDLARQCADAAATAMGRSAGGSAFIDPTSTAAAVELVYPSVAGTLGKAWTDIARWSAAIPAESSSGRLLMATPATLLAAVASPPQGQHAIANVVGGEPGTQIAQTPPEGPAAFLVSGSSGVAAGPRQVLSTVDVITSERDPETGAFSGMATVDAPIGVSGIPHLWDAQPTAPSGSTGVRVTLAAGGASRDVVRVVATSATRNLRLRIPLTGRVLTRHQPSQTRVGVAGAASPIVTPPWVHWRSADPPDLAAYASMAGLLSRTLVRARLRYQLSAVAPAQIETLAQSRWQLTRTAWIQGICERVRIETRRGSLPRATVWVADLLGRGINGDIQPPTSPAEPIEPGGPLGGVATWGASKWSAGATWGE